MDVVGLYPNIPHEESLSALRKRPKTRKEKYVSTVTIIDLAEVVLHISIITYLHLEKRHLSKNRGLLLIQNFHLRIAFYLRQN